MTKTSPSRVALGAGTLLALAGLPALALSATPVAKKAFVPPKTLSAPPKKLAPEAAPQFNRDIRPILSENCFACHGPDKSKRMASLRLDQRDDAVAHGAIVPGKPQESKLIQRVFAADADSRMPPVAFHKELKPRQKELLQRWVRAGAPYEAFWAYIPPRRPAVPVLRDARYPVRNPIDAFIREKLLAKKILPSPEADRRSLIRRVSLDMTGLPPTETEVQAFLSDHSPNAYEKVVDRLLASPHFGERMAVPWLDVVRYADTVGFHGDQNQNAWPYRDYVIDSFNQDKPFDQFTREQIAGDLLPNATAEQRAATCFSRLTMMTREGGAQPKEYLAKYQADRVRTVGMAWMGATLACCECHDHKYDPFTQKDFYSLGAFFADLKQWGVYADYSYTPNPDLKGYNNDFPFPPEIQVESRYLKQRIAADQAKMDTLARDSDQGLSKDAASRAEFDHWRGEISAFLGAHADGWDAPKPDVRLATATPAPRGKAVPRRAKAATTAKSEAAPTPTEEGESGFRLETDHSVTLTAAGAADLHLTLPITESHIASVRVEALPDGTSRPTVLRKGMEAGMVTLTASIRHANGKAEPVSFRYAGANLHEPRYRSGFEVIGVQGGWKPSLEHRGERHVAVWLPTTPLSVQNGDRLEVVLPNAPVVRARVSISPLVPDDRNRDTIGDDLRAAVEHPEGEPARTRALEAFLAGTDWSRDAFTRWKELEQDLLSCRDGKTPVMVAEATTPMTMRVLPRGNWQDTSGPVVEPHVPHFLPGYRESQGKRLTRLDLANWLVSKENPLTARVFVNRLWKQFFGNGISMQVEDLGAQGEWPTHPELLDWLATEFMSPSSSVGAYGSGGVAGYGSDTQAHSNSQTPTPKPWDIKHMVRLIVTSATYRQSSSLRPELRTEDPNNRLLASQNPRRLEAEFVRDNALAIAGLLNPDLGGPPCKPYQPAGYYANIQFPNREYNAETDDRQWRRGIYMHWQRTFLHPMLANFDAPSREDCIASRTVANTPQQALTLLNDPEFVEAARAFAERLLAAPGQTDAARLEHAYQLALGRSIRPKEAQSLNAFLSQARATYKERPDDAKKLLAIGIAPAPAGQDPVELAAWASVCRVVLNLQETITRY